MADVLARVALDHLDNEPSYTVETFGSGWMVEIEGTPGVWIEQFLETEVEAHLRGAELTILMRHE